MKNNVKTGIAYEMKNKNRLEDLKVLQRAKELEQNKNVKYLLKN
jgi:hypothetical protein